MAGYAYRVPRKYRYRRKGKLTSNQAIAAVVVVVAAAAASGGHKTVAGAVHRAGAGLDAVTVAASGGTLSCSGLEALWESAGGSSGEAFMAAEIATAESSGHQYATDNDGNGTVDRGYFQINSIWGALSTYDPAGNARAAVQISHDGTDWVPWVTYDNNAYQGKC